MEYQQRDIEMLDAQCGYYRNHIQAMTTENLISKSQIAAELAYRDYMIDRLEARIQDLTS